MRLFGSCKTQDTRISTHFVWLWSEIKAISSINCCFNLTDLCSFLEQWDGIEDWCFCFLHYLHPVLKCCGFLLNCSKSLARANVHNKSSCMCQKSHNKDKGRFGMYKWSLHKGASTRWPFFLIKVSCDWIRPQVLVIFFWSLTFHIPYSHCAPATWNGMQKSQNLKTFFERR